MDPYRAHGDCNRCVADSRFASCPSGTWCTCCKSPCTAPALFPARVGESVAPVSPWSSALAGAQKTTSTIKRLSFHYRAVPRRLILFPSLFFPFFFPPLKRNIKSSNKFHSCLCKGKTKTSFINFNCKKLSNLFILLLYKYISVVKYLSFNLIFYILSFVYNFLKLRVRKRSQFFDAKLLHHTTVLIF